jgi:hypothetical protein
MHGSIAVVCLFLCACGARSLPIAVPDAGGPEGDAPDGGTTNPDGGTIACGTPWPGDRQFGSALADEALALAIGPNGDVHVGGYEQGINGASGIEPSGNARGFLLELSANGDEVRKRVFATAGTTTVEALAISGPDALVVGRTTGRLGSWNPAGQFDAFLARAPLDGAAPTVLWQGGTERPEHPHNVAVGPGGQVFAAGWIDRYVPSNYVERWDDELTFSLRLAAAGAELLWLRSGTLDVVDTGWGVAADPDRAGGYAVTGVVAAGSSRGPYVRLVAPDGTEAWSRILTPVGLDNAGGVAFAPDGNVLVAGSTFTTLFGKPYGQQDVYVAKLDRDTGATLWSLQYGSTESDWVKAMAVDSRGTIVVAGETLGDFTGTTPPAGDYDVFALLVSADGAVLGTWQRGSPADDQLHAVAFDSCSRALVGGSTAGALFGSQLGQRDAWVAQATF